MARTQDVDTLTLKSLCLVLVWGFFQLLLECPDDIFAFEFCPSDPNIIVGGCVNGQVRSLTLTLVF